MPESPDPGLDTFEAAVAPLRTGSWPESAPITTAPAAAGRN